MPRFKVDCVSKTSKTETNYISFTLNPTNLYR